MASENLERYYKTLHLAPEASSEEVKRAYRALVKVWHPDRFSQTPHMQQQALGKMQAINRAYAKICSASLQHRPHQEASEKTVADRRRSAKTGRIPLWALVLTAFVTLRLVVVHVFAAGALWPQPLPLITSEGPSAPHRRGVIEADTKGE